VNVLLNGHAPPSPTMGKVGAALGPYLEGLGHRLVVSEDAADVMVDFTTPDAVVPNIRRALAAGLPCVIGTTGWDTSEVDELARTAGLAVLYAPNFAIGAVLMMRFAKEASEHFERAEIIELHHETKLDAPSGTAKATAAGMKGDVPIHSVRLPGVIANQEVILGAPGQTLTIRHDTTSREAFAPGVALAIDKVRALSPGVTVGLDSVL